MSGVLIDAQSVLQELRDFQRATATWVFRRMFDEHDPAHRFLVADEVGLGKTHVAKGVVAQVIEHLGTIGDRRHDIVYVCSNGAIARQNLRKLVPRGIDPLDNVERLTMLPLADLSASEGINLLAITPGTSLKFGHSTGQMRERALAYAFMRAIWGAAAFSSSRARRIFWEGAPKQGDAGLRDLERSYRAQVRRAAPAFEVELALIDAARLRHGQASLQDTFEDLVEGLAYQRSFPEELKPLRRSLISDIRRAMATVGIQMLEPDLVILDEFQRFKDLLDPEEESWGAQLARRLFSHRDSVTGRGTRTLLLSATPYRMYTLSDEEGEDHYRDFVNTAAFLLDDEQKVDALRSDLRELRLALTKPGGVERAAGMCRKVGDELRKVMSRTERLAATPDRSGMLLENEPEVRVEVDDISAYLTLGDLAEAAEHHQPTEYWKSSPYLVNFMEGYKLKRGIAELLEQGSASLDGLVSSGRGLIDWEQIERFEPIEPQNGRLRWLLEDLDAKGAFDVLWVPPSMPYYRGGEEYERAHRQGLTKRLVFSGWSVVPKAVSALVSYDAERRAFKTESGVRYSASYARRGGQRLQFSVDKATGRADSMNSLLLLWPSPTLATLGDPRPVRREGISAEEFEDVVVSRVVAAVDGLTGLNVAASGPVDQRWYWLTPLLLDAAHHPNAIDEFLGHRDSDRYWTGHSQAEGFRHHIDEAWTFMAQDEELSLGPPPQDLSVVLARTAIGSPAVCSLRAFQAVSGSHLDSTESLAAASSAAWGFRSYFNGPEVTALLRSRRAGSTAPYWQLVLEECIAGNLQALLDEHAHVLRDWLGFVVVDDDNREDLLEVLGEKMREALDVQTTVHRVDVPVRRNGAVTLDRHGMRCRFAVPFGTHRTEQEGEARIESVSTAFNSPFWPFVLTSTSVGQEGLDFHLWSHAVVHWNLPANPVDLEQREGRVHRYKGHAVRRNLAHHLASVLDGADGDLWQELFELGRSDESEMIPLWIFNEGPARIERHVPVLPFSRDAAHLPRLRQTLAAYRLAIGQPRQEELVQFLLRTLDEEAVAEVRDRLRIDLSPPAPRESREETEPPTVASTAIDREEP